jgi:hypothetical protein
MYSYDRRAASGFSVKRLEPETVLEEVHLAGRTVGLKSPKSVTYAVVDASGKVVKTKNRVTGKSQHEVYPQKGTAQQVADHLTSSPP